MRINKESERENLKLAFLSLFVSALFFFAGWVTAHTNRHFLEGKQTRKVILREGKNFIEQMEKFNLRGRTLLILATSTFSKTPLFVPSNDAEQNIRGMENMLNPEKIEVNNENFTYVALLKRLIKRVYLILPEKEWKKRKYESWGPYLKLKGEIIEGTLEEGTPCTISSEKKPILPRERPVVLIKPEIFRNWEALVQKAYPDIIFFWYKDEKN